jgi:hypothetical protein
MPATPDPAHQTESGPGGDPRRRRRVVAIGGGALLVVVVAVAAVVVATSGQGDGTRLAGNHSSESSSPAPSGNAGVKSHQLSASPQASKRPRATEPAPHQPPAEIGDKVDWSPFAQAYGAATSAASDSRSAGNGVTQLRSSQSFGDYTVAGTVSVTATAQYFASASDARDQYDSTCGSASGKKSGSLASAALGDKACSYVSDVSDGSSGTAILYVQVLRANVILQVAPMAFHNGPWSAADLGKLRAATVQCAGTTVSKL